jgi:hypothetical protein
MTDPFDLLVGTVSARLRSFGLRAPSARILRSLLSAVYLATLRTEESRFVGGSVTYADPTAPNISPPRLRRADYPGFTKFRNRVPLTTGSLLKLARAIDKWSGSIAVWATVGEGLFVWGVLDQMVETNIRLHREGRKGFAHPGLIIVTMDGIGQLSVYHGDCLLGRLRAQEVVKRENDALRSRFVAARVLPTLSPIASSIGRALNMPRSTPTFARDLFRNWTDTIARICIGLRRLGTGGSLVITSDPLLSVLHLGHRLPYRRLEEALALQVLDEWYLASVEKGIWARSASPEIATHMVSEQAFAQEDSADRQSEVSGAVKVVTSLAAVDGLVLLTPGLAVIGFGTKIGPSPEVMTVYDAPAFARERTGAKTLDLSRFGTRHTSMLRYCRMDRSAIGVVVSQDVHVRLIMSIGRSMVLWDEVKLLGYSNYSYGLARRNRNWRRSRSRGGLEFVRGYTKMPKSLAALLRSRE